ncbi:MAG: Sapep family Mn(2+)-dependent dipeptidase, partial [Clostridiales bacterium]|nr:Sapep family Mn(2+)-dependent dipeptidase [Clostridiales bacterium]
MLNDLKQLIAVPSVMGAPEKGAPFGAAPRDALHTFLAIAAKYGMRTKNENGYCGWAEIGEGETCIGILGHLDVVPAGDGWSHDPFTLVCEDGYLYGRGVADDKGPTVAALHAMKRIAQSGVKLRHRVRLIVGCNEENGSECIEYYRNHCEIPVASFVPDADFPLINSEKGILHLTVTLPADEALQQNVSRMYAGERPNVVPDSCTAEIPKGSALYNILALYGRDNSLFYKPQVAAAIVGNGMRTEDFSVHFFEDKLTVEARGVAGHAMAPQKGENAAVKLITFLNAIFPTPA